MNTEIPARCDDRRVIRIQKEIKYSGAVELLDEIRPAQSPFRLTGVKTKPCVIGPVDLETTLDALKASALHFDGLGHEVEIFYRVRVRLHPSSEGKIKVGKKKRP